MEQLLESTGHVVYDFIQFADEKVASGKLARKRLVIPGSKRLLKWLISAFKAEDSHEDDNLGGDINSQNNILQLGEAYKHRKDPEHLPPENMLQKIGDKIRLIPTALRSPESAYGFRVACATMTVAVVSFLHDTQDFFVKQRFVWAMIMVNLSMSPTSGQSIFGFVLRLLGTVLAMVLSLLAWYIPGQKTPGIIVFFFIFLTCVFYVPIKIFRFRIIGIITIISTSMIVGYELEVRKIGEQVAASNGQQYYPIYLLGPYRLATVSAGIAVAFIWTFFPYPISEHSVLRQSLGASLYLLANYYSVIHETVSARMRGDEGDLALKTSSGRRLLKARNKVFSKQMLMLNNLRTYAGFLNWEVAIGGRFPKKRYNSIITCIEKCVSHTIHLPLTAHRESPNTNYHQHRKLPQSSRLRLRYPPPTRRRRRVRLRLAPRLQETSRQRPRHNPRDHYLTMSFIRKHNKSSTAASVSKSTSSIWFLQASGGTRQRHSESATHRGARIRYVFRAADLDTLHRG